MAEAIREEATGMSGSANTSPGQRRQSTAGRPGRAPVSWEGLSPGFVRESAAHRLRVLGHPERLRIVEVLARGPAHVGDVAARLGVPVARVSRHLRAMHEARVVLSSQRGNHVLYALADQDVSRLAAVAYRGASLQVRRVIALAPNGNGRSGSSPASPGSSSADAG